MAMVTSFFVRSGIGALSLVFMLLLFCRSAEATPRIPALKWEKRSDWVSVKSDISPAAVGDGRADDTVALQKGLDRMTHGSVLYLPPGTYRITKTLVNRHAARLSGLLLVGHGRDTRIIWDGKAGGRMLHDAGATHSRYVGFVLDGRGKASVGLYHQNEASFFETEVRHQHLAFLNFTTAGILAEGDPATAEVIIENSLFENCRRGIACLSFNDYDYTIDGCEFRQCGSAVECVHGNVYLRNCHFQGSSGADLILKPEHGSSVRRCSSVGSHSFISFANAVSPLTIQDCHVEGWTDPDGAISLSGAPVLLFDSVFTKPPGGRPPVKLHGLGGKLFISGNSFPTTAGLLQFGLPRKVYEIPTGRRSGAVVSASQHFLQEKVSVPSAIFDVKRDFGARGDGVSDDTTAIQRAIDAARMHGKGGMAYLPSGVYVVRKTLNITGGNYTVGGSGFRSGLLWKGGEGGTIISVHDPQNLVLENMAIGNHDTGLSMNNGIDILQSGSGKGSAMTYDNVTVFGMYQNKPYLKGLWLKGLGKESTVLIRQMEGNIHLVDSAQATILLNNTYEGSLVVEGKDKRRGGFLGVLTHLSTSSDYALYVRDNHSLVASDFFIEQTEHGFLLEGKGDDPPGRITIQCAKMHLRPAAGGNPACDIREYAGAVFLGSPQFYVEPKRVLLRHQGGRPLDLFLFAGSFYQSELAVQKGESARVRLVGNNSVTGALLGSQVTDEMGGDTLQRLAEALDDLRLLGELDLRLNH